MNGGKHILDGADSASALTHAFLIGFLYATVFYGLVWFLWWVVVTRLLG